jgi:hypothetical protein
MRNHFEAKFILGALLASLSAAPAALAQCCEPDHLRVLRWPRLYTARCVFPAKRLLLARQRGRCRANKRNAHEGRQRENRADTELRQLCKYEAGDVLCVAGFFVSDAR